MDPPEASWGPFCRSLGCWRAGQGGRGRGRCEWRGRGGASLPKGVQGQPALAGGMVRVNGRGGGVVEGSCLGDHLAFTRRVVLLWYGAEPIGVCVFSTPAASLTVRSRYFG